MRKAVTRMFGVCADAIVVLALQSSDRAENSFDGRDGGYTSRKSERANRKTGLLAPLNTLRVSLTGSR